MKGFTLIELMVVVVMIGIMAAIAYPSYVYLILKSQRTEALTSLTQTQMTLERCYAEHFSYREHCPLLGAFPQTSAQKHYRINLSNLSKTTYTLTATAIKSQTKDQTCAEFTINETHEKKAYNAFGVLQEHCWM